MEEMAMANASQSLKDQGKSRTWLKRTAKQ